MLPGITVNMYGICFSASLILGLIYLAIGSKKSKIPRETTILSLLLTYSLALLGAKYFSFFEHLNNQANLFKTGFTSSGGAIGMILGIIIISFVYPDKQIVFWNVYSIALPLMYAVGKIGCHFAGCCHGFIYSGPFAITYPNGDCAGKPLFPVQLLETVIFFIIFIVGCYLYYVKNNYSTVYIIIILCSITKMLLDFLRYEHIGQIISTNQIACLVIAIITPIAIKYSTQKY